ncbi:unnamed protein product [Cylicostephanus goldi]|uniref:Uncharacterized protein n=1 Tax=Cylicostephanus goldi TaxID=71465 RepID=A0A3P6TUE2_CYLGO|nr:unnamed protein product [Cylicostephanus goldi]
MLSLSLRRNLGLVSITVTLFEVIGWHGELRKLGRATLEQNEIARIRSLRIEVIHSAKSWFNSEVTAEKPLVHNVKVDILVDNKPVSYFKYFLGPPELDLAYYDDPLWNRCDPQVECCLMPHYVNFTEIGHVSINQQTV